MAEHPQHDESDNDSHSNLDQRGGRQRQRLLAGGGDTP